MKFLGIHFHKWSAWSNPVPTYNGGHKQQWRVCTTCNYAKFRTLKWDHQTSVKNILDAVAEVKS